ncbi:uncharacterized protein si:ch211-284e13.5 [Hoplias malabaricus]|uniref:uncharacterized protein si:ch211-284e13.5 n=1 Tax=Hoplias malabaricus TaxID=27720 RepID=UPI003461C9D7
MPPTKEKTPQNSINVSPVVAELSLSFRDELTASIQGALAVAVQIAVADISELVAHALQDVREQMRETLRDNERLESRLRGAEGELRVARERLALTKQQQQRRQRQQRRLPRPSPPAPAPVRVPSPERVAHVERKYEVNANGNGYEGESFCEIREDGSVRTKDFKPDMTEKSAENLESAQQLEAQCMSPGVKGNAHSAHEIPTQFNQACLVPNNEAGTSALTEGPVIIGVTSVSEVAVKVENTEHCNGPETEEERFVSDCLSLAQSRILEDWRSELQLQNCQSHPYTPASNTLVDPSIFPGEIPELDFLTSAVSSQSDPFPTQPHSHSDDSSFSGHVPVPPPQLYPAHSSSPSKHVCKVCSQSFNRLQDLRRHRTLMHLKKAVHHHRGPKHSLFPPGRSPYHCSQCGRDFNRGEHLKIHQRIHTGERPYVCTVCSARFRHSWALKRHLRIHTGEMPYQCGQCGRTFRNCGGLKFHQRSHAKGK